MVCRAHPSGVLLGFSPSSLLTRQANKTPNGCGWSAPAAPAPGFRDSGYNKGHGTLYAVGRYGYFWSSTIPSGSGNALYLHFYYEGIRQQSHCVRAYGFPLRCLQEHPEGVLLGFSPPNLEPGLRAKKRVSQFGLPHPVGAQPSRGEYNFFLSPARAAGAPTFCDATESRQRTQPRGLRPLGHPPTTATRRKFGLAPTPLRLCKTPVGVPSGTAEAGDAKHRDQLYKTSPPRNQPQA